MSKEYAIRHKATRNWFNPTKHSLGVPHYCGIAGLETIPTLYGELEWASDHLSRLCKSIQDYPRYYYIGGISPLRHWEEPTVISIEDFVIVELDLVEVKEHAINPLPA